VLAELLAIFADEFFFKF